jgi:hypothetical protein
MLAVRATTWLLFLADITILWIPTATKTVGIVTLVTVVDAQGLIPRILTRIFRLNIITATLFACDLIHRTTICR